MALLRELVELALALSFFLLWRHLSDDSFRALTLHALPVALGRFGGLTISWVELVGSELVSGDTRLLLRQELVVLGLLGEELSLKVVGLRVLLHLTELVRQGFAGLVWLRPLLASLAGLLPL